MRKLLIGLVVLFLGQSLASGQCTSDTISNDIIMLVDNSASINNAEFGSFSNIILSTINRIAEDCPLSRRGVVHYGGAFGQGVNIEHQLSSTATINAITRQYCLNATCNDGGDDLNYAMGEIIKMINNNELQLIPGNRLSIVVFTDAFSEPFCGSPNCSVTLPTTNVDSLKGTYGANVSVIGMSSSARPEFLAISASPGGNYSATNLNNACNSSIDGCTLPRQFIPVEFTDNPMTVGAQVAALVSCRVNIMTTANVDAGADVSICGDRGESASLMAVPTSGQAPYTYEWSNNLGTESTVTASPAISTTFTVTITDDDGCQGTDQVRVNVQNCGPDCVDDTLNIGGVVILEPKVRIDAGPDQTFCENLNETATINLLAIKGQQPITYQWDQNQGTNSSITVRPLVPTTYHVTATDANNCEAVDSIRITPIQCSDCFAVAGTPLPHKEICLENGRAFITTEDNIGINVPQGYEKVYVLTDANLTIVDYAINNGSFSVNKDGVYRVHTLVAEVNRRNDENYFDINLIKRGISNLFVIANCIVDHNICADFDFPGRVHVVLPLGDMMCMTFENTINLCTDGIDNDSDGLVDCNDEDCKALIPCQENTLIACNDLYDNDGDGLVDCFDSDCWEFIRCFEREENCKDGIDNDGDGLIDCEDDSCFGSDECMENSPYTCKDGIDNDRDGLVDCAEESCREFLVCAEWGEDACSDGIDNDFDGLVDCADAECRISFATSCGATESTAGFCSDGIDNDSDGLVDCDDPDCGATSMSLEMISRALSLTNATCPNNNNGGLSIELGQSGWEYSIDGGDSFSTTSSYDNLVIGDYNLVIRRNTGCMVVGPIITITGEQCPEICDNGLDDDGDGAIDCADTDCRLMEALPAVVTDPVCPQVDNGSIRLFFLSGGNTAGIEYSIDGVVWQNSPMFRNLTGGTYNVELRSDKGCTASKRYVLSSPDCPEVCNNGLDDDGDGAVDCDDTDCGISLSEENVSIGEPSCPAKDNATITVTHNQSGLRYMLDDNPIQDEAIFENLSVGSYLLTVVNSGGCRDTLRVNIADVECSEICDNGIDDDGDGMVDCEDGACIAGLEPTIEKIDASCPLNNNGSITVSGNITGFSFVLNDQEAQSSGVFSDLEPGSYSLRITNASGCSSTQTFEITGVTCTEDCTNGIDDDGNGLIDCEDASCQLGLDATPTATASSCPDNNNGTIRVDQQQGSMDYSLNGGTFQEAGLFENLSPGDYTLRIRNASACISEQTVIVEGVTCTEICDNGIDDDNNGLVDCDDGACSSGLTLEFSPTDASCPNNNNGSIQIVNSDNSSEYSIDGENFQSESLFEDLLSGDYTLTKRNIQGCTFSVDVTIEAEVCGGVEICDNGIDDDGDGLIDCQDGSCKTFSNFIVTANPPSCLEEDDGIILVIDGLEGYQYSLSGSAFQLGTSFNGLSVGEYLLTIRNLEGCDTTITRSLTAEASCASISEGIEVAMQMDIKVLLEGPFDPSTGTMHTQLNDEGYLPGQRPITFFGKATPPGQPYAEAPWFYDGREGDQLIDNNDRLQSAYDETIVDWVLVSLRRGLTKQTEVFRGAGLLHSNGQIEMQRLMEFTENGIQYFIVIEHRNHLPIMSAIPVPVVQGGISFDFTNRDSYRSIIGTGQISNNGTFMMAAGNGEMILDYSSDTDINVRDLTLWLLNNGENSSYYAEDYDLNGDINIKDRILWEKNNGIFSPLKTK